MKIFASLLLPCLSIASLPTYAAGYALDFAEPATLSTSTERMPLTSFIQEFLLNMRVRDAERAVGLVLAHPHQAGQARIWFSETGQNNRHYANMGELLAQMLEMIENGTSSITESPQSRQGRAVRAVSAKPASVAADTLPQVVGLASEPVEGKLETFAQRLRRALAGKDRELLLKLVNTAPAKVEKYAKKSLRAAAKATDRRKAIRHYRRAYRLYRLLADRKRQSYAAAKLGLHYGKLGQYRKALYFYKRALKIRRRFEDRPGQFRILYNLGLTYKKKGQYRQARRYYRMALKLAQALDKAKWIASTRKKLGELDARVQQAALAKN